MAALSPAHHALSQGSPWWEESVRALQVSHLSTVRVMVAALIPPPPPFLGPLRISNPGGLKGIRPCPFPTPSPLSPLPGQAAVPLLSLTSLYTIILQPGGSERLSDLPKVAQPGMAVGAGTALVACPVFFPLHQWTQ